MRHLWTLGLTATAMVIAWLSILAATAGGPSADPHRAYPLTFQTEEGHVFDARIVAPTPDRRNGRGVLLLGGGVGNDLDWSVPGSVEVGGEKRQTTISGETHADAPRIARAFADRGFAVMHWSTIRRGDPKRDRWPLEATVYPPKIQLDHAKAALAAFRKHGLLKDDRVILCGHSLGAVRAANIAAADDRIAGMVLLAPAQVTRTSKEDVGRNTNRQPATEFMRSVDQDEDSVCTPAEFRAWRAGREEADDPVAGQSFERLDFDRDRTLRVWEISAGMARGHRRDVDLRSLPRTDRFGLRWAEDILTERHVPTLIVYGGLDNAQGHHAPIMAEVIRAEKLRHVTIEILPKVGHQLGPEEGDRIGPISEPALTLIAEWSAGIEPGG